MTDPVTPGLYPDMPAETYHADPALSASGATQLLPPSCPAIYAWHRTHPTPRTKALDLGSVAHRFVLSEGDDFAIIPDNILAKNGAASTSEAKTFIAEQRAAGVIPVKQAEHDQIKDMADALAAHPIAGRIFTGPGAAEQSLFWTDENGTPRRARLDWLPDNHAGRLIIADYKTARTANPAKWARSAPDYGYHLQDANYRQAVTALGLSDEPPAFVFVLQEKTPPYLVSVVQLDGNTRALGETEMGHASRIHAACTASGRWPGYPDEVVPVGFPEYLITNRLEQSHDLTAAITAAAA